MSQTEGLEDKLQQILNDPESMSQILSLAQSFGLQQPPESPGSAPVPPPTPDAGMLQGVAELMQQARRSDGKQEALLGALKPFLRPERREKLDRAMQLARISHLAGYALRHYGGLPPEKGG